MASTAFSAAARRALRLLQIRLNPCHTGRGESVATRAATRTRIGVGMGALRITGTVEDIDRRSGKNDDGTPYSTIKLFVPAGRFTYPVRVADDYEGDLPRVGEQIEAAVYVTAYNGRIGLTCTDLAVLKGEPVKGEPVRP